MSAPASVDALYQSLWHKAKPLLLSNQCQIDSLLDNPADSRRGLTVLTYLQQQADLIPGLSALLSTLQQLEPAQYVYPLEDLHVTIQSVVSCYAGFEFPALSHGQYGDVFHQASAGQSGFTIRFQGLCASSEALMLQGYVDTNALQTLRQRLTQQFQSSGLETRINQRYPLIAAHVTLMRFRAPLARPAELVAFIEAMREQDLGSLNAGEIQLVFNNWYQQQRFSRTLASVSLPLG